MGKYVGTEGKLSLNYKLHLHKTSGTSVEFRVLEQRNKIQCKAGPGCSSSRTRTPSRYLLEAPRQLAPSTFRI